MEVILTKDIDKLGKSGSVVKVKEGYARNFLFVHNLAKPATAGNLKKIEQEKEVKDAQFAKAKDEALLIKERLSSLSLTIPALTGAEEKLYGSIHSHDISEALKEEGFLIDKADIDLSEPIKSLGIYEVPVKLHPQVVAQIKLWVVKK